MKARALSVLLLSLPTVAGAQVVFDGSLGPTGSLSGDMLIGEDWGTRVGGNLFHSFHTFNIHAGESVTFTSHFAGVTDNVIGRVTGGSLSLIDGRLSSTIPGSALWLINPAGVVFGSGASLDVQGAFSVSTADYLLLEDGGRFSAALEDTTGTVLTMANPVAFGFLGDGPAPITVTGSVMTGARGHDLRLVGGDLTIEGGQLVTGGGDVMLASVSGSGEIDAASGVTDIADFGTLTLSDAEVNADGPGGGTVWIRGGQLVIDEGTVVSSRSVDGDGGGVWLQGDALLVRSGVIDTTTAGDGQGGAIDIQVAGAAVFEQASYLRTVTENDGNAGDISVTSDSLTLLDGSVFDTSGRRRGAAGDVDIRVAGQVLIEGEIAPGQFSGITVKGGSLGDTGTITVAAGDVILKDGGFLFADAAGEGSSGRITIDARDRIVIDNWTLAQRVPGIFVFNIGVNGDFRASSGVAELNARRIIMDYGNITATMDRALSDGGAVILNASESIVMAHESFVEMTSRDTPFYGGTLRVATPYLEMTGRSTLTTNIMQFRGRNPIGGAAGDIFVDVGTLVMDGGIIEAQVCSCASGAAGNITINVRELLQISGYDAFDGRGAGIRTTVWGGETGGNITITASEIQLFDGGAIISDSPATRSSLANEGFTGLVPGDAGNIDITANRLLMMNEGAINTSAVEAGGGIIRLDIGELMYLERAAITAEAFGVQPENGGGNIFIAHPEVVVLNDASIVARANAGNGGNIGIATEVLIPSLDSVIDASSQRGVDGVVVIDSPNQQVTTTAVLSAPAFEAADMARDPCVVLLDEERSSLTVSGNGGVPDAPDAYQVCPVPTP